MATSSNSTAPRLSLARKTLSRKRPSSPEGKAGRDAETIPLLEAKSGIDDEELKDTGKLGMMGKPATSLGNERASQASALEQLTKEEENARKVAIDTLRGLWRLE